jgi:hypothetical protein
MTRGKEIYGKALQKMAGKSENGKMAEILRLWQLKEVS